MGRLPGPRTPAALARHGLRLARAPHVGMRGLYEEHGQVAAIGMGPMRFVFLFGREANQYILSEHPENFRWREALAALIPVDGDTALVVSDGEEHKRRRRLVQPAFHTRRIHGYLDIMCEEADAAIATLRPGATVDFYALMRPVIRRIVVRALFGQTFKERADEFGDLLQPAIEFIDRSPALQVKVNLPGTPYRRARQARAAVDAIVDAEVARRRREGDLGEDLLGMLLSAKDEDGSELTDEELRDQVVSLIAAGYDTTSAAVGWAVYGLVRHQQVWDRLAEEVVGEGRPTVEEIIGFRYLDAVVKESLRLWPPGIGSARKAVGDFEFGGHRVRGGSFVLYSTYVTHQLPELWGHDAAEYRPERWLEDEPPPYSYVPFGGGYRRCIGFAFAELEIKAILVELLRAGVRLSPAWPDAGEIEGTGVATLRPKGGVPVHVAAAG